MNRIKILVLILFSLLFSCTSPVHENNLSAPGNSKVDSDSMKVSQVINGDSTLVLDSSMIIVKDKNHLNKTDSVGVMNSTVINDSLEIRIFSNSDIGGYGYDIMLNGKPYVHQPTIPAVQGIRSFATEDQARQTASLVAEKIRQNIMPPTLSKKELESLGIK